MQKTSAKKKTAVKKTKMSAKTATEKRDIAYKAVTDHVISLIEENELLPFQMPWTRSNLSQQNMISKKPYRGINAFVTAMTAMTRGFTSPFWLTYKQATEKGGQVKKGEKSTPCIFFRTFEKTDKETGEKETVFIPRYYNIFNLDQIEGIESPKVETPEKVEHNLDAFGQAQAVLSSISERLPPVIEGGDKAYYRPETDLIRIPDLELFKSTPEYFSTTFHEAIHSTGHKSRLNRFKPEAFGKHEYSKEELVAEFGACFLNADAGILPATINNSAAYLQGWLKALKSNPKWLTSAASAAQRAVEYLYTEKNEDGES